MSKGLPKLDENVTSREHKRMHLESVKRADGRCILCPPHRYENDRRRRKHGTQQKRRPWRDQR